MSNFHLNEIYSPPNGLPAADIVFLHGLGDAFETCWQSSTSKEDHAWPVWLSDAFPGVSIWGIDYPTSKFNGLLSKPDLSLLTVASSLSELLRAKKIGKRPVIFVCHSLGGVITKAILRACESTTTPTKRAIFENCRGVIFIASPHSGSSLASVLSWIPGLASKQTHELEKAASILVDLFVWYQNKAPSSGISSCALYETLPTKGAIVVDAGSANPGVPNCDPIPIDANHTEICKFRTKDDFGYLAVKNFIEETLHSAGVDTTDHAAIDDLEYYINSVKGDRLSLAQKMKLGGRSEKEIEDAEAEKERIFKIIRRNAVSATARKKYRQFLSEVLTLFRLYVAPLVRSGADEKAINDAIHSKLLAPLSQKAETNDLFNIADMHSAIYYLSGNCHIDWAKSSD